MDYFSPIKEQIIGFYKENPKVSVALFASTVLYTATKITEKYRGRNIKKKVVIADTSTTSTKLNQFGFASATYDDSTDTPLIHASIRKQMLAALPKDYKTSWKYYVDGFVWLFGYASIYAATSYCQYRLSVQYVNDKSIMNRVKISLLSPLYAWSFVGIGLTGHDAVHGTFAPKGTKLGKIVNNITPFFTLDMIIFSSWIWNKQHTMHHKNINVEGVDDMYIRGTDPIEEQFWSLGMVVNYWLWDLEELCFNWKLSGDVLFRKVKILTGSCLRFYFIYYKFANGDPYLVLSNFWFMAVMINYMGFLSHSIPVTSKGKTDDYFIWAMRETWDIFPQSPFMNFLHCGNGGHCSHHVFPYLPRSLFGKTSEILEKYCKDEYRKIDTIQDELWLFWNRRSEM